MGKKKKKKSGSICLPFPDTECVNAAMRVFTGLYYLEQLVNRTQTKKREKKKNGEKKNTGDAGYHC